MLNSYNKSTIDLTTDMKFMNRLFTQNALAGIYFLLIVTLGSCMWMPAARDDLSVLGDDPFSNLIRKAYSEINLVPVNSNGTGVSQIERQKATQLARELLLGGGSLDVIALFNQEGGRCLPPSSDAKEKLLTCEVSRRWKLKNIGAPTDTSNWSDPVAKLVFKMTLSGTDVVVGLELDIIDTTVYKPIKG